jgi:CubicO group peptidase (beta-lactamase class C family)
MAFRGCRALIAALLAASSATAARADPADDYVHSFMAKTHAPGVALAVIRDGKVVKKATYGYANLEWHQPVTTAAPFWLDSLTKLITAVGLMQLAEQGKLSLGDPVTKYLTDAPAEWHAVTIRHLLAHTSGIKDNYWQLYRGSPLLNYDENDIYAYATKQPLLFKPGAQYQYDNEGYYLLGLVIAKATGEPYSKWITDHVLRPAGMKTARVYKAGDVIPHIVSSYALDHGRVVHNRADIMSDRGEAVAGWGIYASLDDMIAFDEALQRGALVSRKSLDAMWTNARLNSGYPSQSGLGFEEIRYPLGHRIAAKGGQAGTEYSVFPDDRLSVIFLTNIESSAWQNHYDAIRAASFYDPEIKPFASLRPRADPQPARTAMLKRALADIASGAVNSPFVSPGMSGSLTPEFRAQTKQLLAALSNLQFLGCERPSPHDPYGATSYCYYRMRVPPGTLDLGFGLDSQGRLASGIGHIE